MRGLRCCPADPRSARDSEIAELKAENGEHKKKQEEADAVIQEKKELEKTIQQQELTINKQVGTSLQGCTHHTCSVGVR